MTIELIFVFNKFFFVFKFERKGNCRKKRKFFKFQTKNFHFEVKTFVLKYLNHLKECPRVKKILIKCYSIIKQTLK